MVYPQKNRISLMAACVVAIITATAAVLAADKTVEVPYPTNYRDWTHVKSMVIEPGHALDATFGGPTDDEVWGFLNAADPDGPSSITWHTAAESIYGDFLLQTTGDWSFRLDNSRAATQGLAEGQSVTETFVVTASDAFGASSAQEVTITIVGSYDAPAP